MFDAVIQSIKSFGSFSEDEEKDFCSHLKTQEIKKGQTLLKVGEVCKEFCFVLRGSFVQSFKDDSLNYVIVNLFTQFDWTLNHASFTGQKTSLHKIEAFEDSTIQVLSIHDLHALIGLSSSFFVLGKILEVVHDYKNPMLSPDQKYQLLLDQKPVILRTFPLKYVSSYLGMTPETLSRVRSRIS